MSEKTTYETMCENLLKKCETLRTENEEMRELLKRLEWSGCSEKDTDYEYCPYCQFENKHQKDCTLAKWVK